MIIVILKLIRNFGSCMHLYEMSILFFFNHKPSKTGTIRNNLTAMGPFLANYNILNTVIYDAKKIKGSTHF